jgi:hypothetical protein
VLLLLLASTAFGRQAAGLVLLLLLLFASTVLGCQAARPVLHPAGIRNCK